MKSVYQNDIIATIETEAENYAATKNKVPAVHLSKREYREYLHEINQGRVPQIRFCGRLVRVEVNNRNGKN